MYSINNKLNSSSAPNEAPSYASFKRCFSLFIITLFILLLSGCNKPKVSKLQQIINKGTLTVVTRNSPTTYYQIEDDYAGVEYELVNRFADFIGVKATFIVEDNLKIIHDMVNDNQVDFAAAGLTITSDRERSVRFAPSYQQITSKLVFKQGKKWPRKMEQLNGELRIVAHSSYAEELLRLKATNPQLRWSETSEQTSEELLMMVLDESIDYTIVDSTELELNRRFHPELAVAFTIGNPQNLSWAFPKDNGDYSLFTKVIEFFGEQRAQGKISQLNDKYYGHIEHFDYVGARTFHQATKDQLTKYKALFINSAKSDLDWRLLAAIGYQESHWKSTATSPTGVRGLMMLTLNTAKLVGVKDRLDPIESIYGGAKYLRKVLNKVPERIQEPDRTWFALAGYNVGWGHVEDARIITQKQGANPNKWSDVKERLPLLQKKKWYRKTKHGYARGLEPVKYVTNIRRYYDVLVWQDEEQQPETPELDSPYSDSKQKTLTAQ